VAMMRVLVAMSGGVDSSVAAARMVDAGHDVVGVHLALSSAPGTLRTGSRGCCSKEDAGDARRVADILDIPFYVWDFADRFKEDVIDDFVESYARGETPNPCVRCNERIKFSALSARALALGFDAVATGHYARLVDEHDDPKATTLLGLLTPVAKTWSSEYGLAANDLAIQILGGYGYTRDFVVEQLWRDNRLNPIHEGTTGIQAIDLLGRKILRSDGTALAIGMARVSATRARAAKNAELSAHASALGEIWARIEQTIAVLRSAPSARAYDNATFFLWAFGHAVLAWLWLDQVVAAAAAQDGSLYPGKLRACRFFFEIELPRAHAWLGVVASLSGVATEMSTDDF